MGTRFRTMLAPIGLPTGDGRRFADGGIELAPAPFPFEWVRSREGGHSGAVGVGVVQETAVLSVADALKDGWTDADAVKGMDRATIAVWARGEMFDDIDREAMPRLAEDVAEALHLIGEGTLGPSVDLDSFEAVPVLEGTNEPITWDDIEGYMEEHGEEPKIELLVTSGRVRAATLVSIPAFAETSRPMLLDAAEALAASEYPDSECEIQRNVRALIASVAEQARSLPEIAMFDAPALAGPTPITFDRETGRVFGHIATWRTCHVGYEGVCITPPRDDEAGGYAWFNRHPVETADGVVWAGRITVGGRHAGLALSASSAMAAYDDKTVAAHVRAYSDEHGIVVSGVLEPDLDARTWAVLDRRKVSGDWRETPGGLTLVEVLALSPGPRAHAEPGFPVETFSRAGRQVALTASLGPVAETELIGRIESIDIQGAVRAALAEDRAAQAARAELTAALNVALNAERALADEERAVLAAALITTEG